MTSTTTKYFEFNSKYRNRNLFPNPGQFQVTVSQSGVRSQQYALDPNSSQAPLITIYGAEFPTNLNFTYNPPGSGSPYPNTIDGMSGSNNIVVYSTSAVPVSGAYDGNSIYWTNPITPNTIETKRIVTSTYLGTVGVGGNVYFLFTLDQIFDQFVASTSAQTLTITTGTDLTSISSPYIYIPFSLAIDNYLNGYVIYNDTVSLANNSASYSQIISFNGTTHIAQLNPLPTTWTYASDTFSVRQAPPTIIGTLVNNAVLTLTRISGGTGYPANGTALATTGGTGTGLTVSWNGAVGGVLPSNITIVNHGYGYTAADTITVTGGTGGQFTVSSVINYTNSTGVFITQNLLDSSYINSFIDLPTVLLDSNTEQTVVRIASISGNLGFVSPSTTVFSTVKYEILQFTVDNYVPFTYTGTLVSTTQPTAYDISLVSLTLPNQPLNVGSKIGFYPYVHVEFENISNSSSGPMNLIYSNDPYANKTTFRVPIQQLSFPNTELFTENIGYMTQRMIFKQGDDIRITIRLPSGAIFQTITTDNLSPLSPNDFLQISALFSVKPV